jgi:creatinine amidohydrolase
VPPAPQSCWQGLGASGPLPAPGARVYRRPMQDETVVGELFLERMTSPQVQAALQAGFTTAVVACGAVEQHGPHLPLFVDAEHGTRLALEVARRLGDALVAPTIRVGCSEHHMRFAGSLTVRVETFKALCHDYSTSLARHGFRRIYFIPSHGGNFAPLSEILSSLNEAAGAEVQVVAFTELSTQIELWRRVVEEESGLGSRVGGHADIAEGSIMLALHPELVRQEDAVAGYAGPLTPEVIRQLFAHGIGALSPNGILGDARGLSAAMGRRCIAETADLLVRYFREQAGDGLPPC